MNQLARTARSSGSQIPLFDNGNGQPSGGGVEGTPNPSYATSNNQNI
jgi:hypothetical protein